MGKNKTAKTLNANEGNQVKPKLSRGRTDSGEPMKDSSINSGEKLRGNKDVVSNASAKQPRRVSASLTPATPRWTFREFPDHVKPSKPTKVLEPRDKHLKGRCSGTTEEDDTLRWLASWCKKCKFHSDSWWRTSDRIKNLARFIASHVREKCKDESLSTVIEMQDQIHNLQSKLAAYRSDEMDAARAEGFEDGKKLQKYAHCPKHGWNCDRCDTCIEDAKKKCEREFVGVLLRDVEWARKDERAKCESEFKKRLK